jgi:hypothetical protein
MHESYKKRKITLMFSFFLSFFLLFLPRDKYFVTIIDDDVLREIE